MKLKIIFILMMLNSFLFAGINEDYIESIKKNNTSEVSRLLYEGADPNFIDKDTKNGLILAAEKGYSQIIEIILKKNIDINYQDKNGKTALIYSITYGSVKSVELLINKSSDTTLKDSSKQSAFDYAVKSNNNIIIEMLSKYINIQLLNEVKNNTDIKKIEKLLETGANPNYLLKEYKKDNETYYSRQSNENILEIAIKNKNIEILDLLIKNKAIADYYSLKMAFSNKEIFEHLLKSGVDLTTKKLLLISAIESNKYDIFELLIKYGANINDSNNNVNNLKQVTPLMYACHMGLLDFVELLVKSNVEINAFDKDFKTALDYAIHEEIKKYLIENNAWSFFKFNQYIIQNEKDLIEKFLKAGLDINFKTNNIIPLFQAVIYGNKDLLYLFLKYKVDLNINDDSDKNCLIYLIENYKNINIKNKQERIEIINILIDEKININDADNEGRTPLIHACINVNYENDLKDVIQILVEKGAKVNIQDNNGRSAIMGLVLPYQIDTFIFLYGNKADLNLKDNQGKSVIEILKENRLSNKR